MSGNILVFGSLNVDFTVFVKRRPQPGETIVGESFAVYPGGKGANQAVAASRAGGRVVMAGRIGEDVFSDVLATSLREAGVESGLVRKTPGTPTGSAFITVDSEGQNSIIVAPGANAAVSEDDVLVLKDALVETRMLLLQLEIPLCCVERAARLASEMGVPVMLDPAPAVPLEPGLLSLADVITPNQHEAGVLTGQPVTDLRTAEMAALKLVAMGSRRAVVKLGSQGVVYAGGGMLEHIPGHEVSAVDTTAAGDAFSGALAVALCEGKTFPDACRFANAAGAVSVTKPGAQTSLPRRKEIEELLEGRGDDKW